MRRKNFNNCKTIEKQSFIVSFNSSTKIYAKLLTSFMEVKLSGVPHLSRGLYLFMYCFSDHGNGSDSYQYFIYSFSMILLGPDVDYYKYL